MRLRRYVNEERTHFWRMEASYYTISVFSIDISFCFVTYWHASFSFVDRRHSTGWVLAVASTGVPPILIHIRQFLEILLIYLLLHSTVEVSECTHNPSKSIWMINNDRYKPVFTSNFLFDEVWPDFSTISMRNHQFAYCRYSICHVIKHSIIAFNTGVSCPDMVSNIIWLFLRAHSGMIFCFHIQKYTV